MQHRHLSSTVYSRAAIDSVLEYGDLPDWRELFERARHDRELAQEVLFMARAHYVTGASPMAQRLVWLLWPELHDDH